MKDFFGQDLAVGDEVAFMEPGYRNMIVGSVISFTDKSMLIQWNKDYRWSKITPPHLETFRATSKQVIKKPS